MKRRTLAPRPNDRHRRVSVSRLAGGAWTTVTTRQGLPNDNVRAILEAPDGAFWIGTDGGLALYHGGAFRKYGLADGLSNEAIYSLHIDTAGVLWVSTLGGGLHRFDGERFAAFTTQQGLFDSVIFQILDDESGHLWMSSNRGVGFLIEQSSAMFDTASTFAGLVVLAVVGAAINGGLKRLERHVLRWRAG